MNYLSIYKKIIFLLIFIIFLLNCCIADSTFDSYRYLFNNQIDDISILDDFKNESIYDYYLKTVDEGSLYPFHSYINLNDVKSYLLLNSSLNNKKKIKDFINDLEDNISNISSSINAFEPKTIASMEWVSLEIGRAHV